MLWTKTRWTKRCWTKRGLPCQHSGHLVESFQSLFLGLSYLFLEFSLCNCVLFMLRVVVFRILILKFFLVIKILVFKIQVRVFLFTQAYDLEDRTWQEFSFPFPRDTGYRIRIPDTGYRIPNTGSRMSCINGLHLS